MPKYKIGLIQKVWEEATIYVIASNQEDAEKAAQEYPAELIEWHFLEANDASEIVSVDLCETDQ